MMSRYRLPYLDHPYAADLPFCFEEQDSSDGFDAAPDLLGAFVDIEDVTYCDSFEVEDSTPLKSNNNYNSNNSSSSNNNNNNSSSSNNNNNNNKKQKKKKSGCSSSSKKERVADEYEGSVTRCICDFQHDDGFMISCDRCCVWQHVDCMALDRHNIPEAYLCELCQPRSFDKRRAVKLQLKKKEEMDLSEESSSEEEDDNDDDDDDEDVDERPRNKGILGKSSTKRKTSHGDGVDNDGSDFATSSSSAVKNKRKRKSTSDDKVESVTENVYLKPYCRKRPRLDSGTDSRFSRSDTTATSSPPKKPPPAAVSRRRHSGNGYDGDYDDRVIRRNVCSDRVSQLLSGKGRNLEASQSVAAAATGDSRLRSYEEQTMKRKFNVFQVEPSVKGIVATELIRSGHAVTEYSGIVTTKEEYEKSSLFDPTYPSVLCCTLEDGSKICVDARQMSNNYVKYIRPSCLPNAKVEHISDRNGIRFFICATKNISAGKEITLPFLFNYKSCSGRVACPCKRSNCAVTKFYKLNNNNNNNSHKKSGRLQTAKSLLKSPSNTSPGFPSRVPTDASATESKQQLVFRDYDQQTGDSSGSSRDANHLLGPAAPDQLFDSATAAGFDALDSSKDSFDSSDELGPLVIAEFPISRKKALQSRGNDSRFKPENDDRFFV